MAAALGAVVDPHRGHSQRLGRREILGHVVDQQRLGRIDAEPLAQQSIAVRVGLGTQFAGVDVVKLVEVRVDPDRLEHPPGIWRIAVGEDELAAGQAGQGRGEARIGPTRSSGICMDVFEEVLRVDAVVLHQTGEGRAMLVEVRFLHALGLFAIAAEQPLDIRAHSLVDQREQSRRRRVQAIVEVENPVARHGRSESP